VKVAGAFAEDGSISGKRSQVQFEGIEIVAVERGDQNAAQLRVIAGHFEFLDGAAHGKIVDHDLPLIDGALRHAPQLSKLRVIQMLNPKPNAGSHHRQHQTQGAAVGQSKKG